MKMVKSTEIIIATGNIKHTLIPIKKMTLKK